MASFPTPPFTNPLIQLDLYVLWPYKLVNLDQNFTRQQHFTVNIFGLVKNKKSCRLLCIVSYDFVVSWCSVADFDSWVRVYMSRVWGCVCVTWSASEVDSMLISSLSAVNLHICSHLSFRRRSRRSKITPEKDANVHRDKIHAQKDTVALATKRFASS